MLFRNILMKNRSHIRSSIFLLFVLISCSVAAQDKGYIGICFGASNPIGNFASKNSNNDHAGYAMTGAIFDITFAYKLGRNAGIAGLIRGQANPLDENAFEEEVSKQYPGNNWSADSDPWRIGGLMGGLYLSFPVSEKISFDARALIGFLNATSPAATIAGDFFPYNIYIHQSSANASAFSVLLGGGFKFDVGKRICLLLNLDYLAAQPEFVNVEQTSNFAPATKRTFTQEFTTINFGFGIAYRL